MNPRSSLPAVVLDALLVVLFAGIGRRSHTLDLTVVGVLETAWPFLAGLAATWLIVAAWRHPVDPIRAGIPLWIGTIAFGMTLRVVATGADFVWPFFLVATGTVGLLLVGWRALSARLRRGNPSPPAARRARGPQR